MVTVLITSFLILAVISFAIYRWQRTVSSDDGNHALPPPPNFEGLFAESVSEEQFRFNAAQLESDQVEKRRELLKRAVECDKKTLSEAQRFDDGKFYDEVLNELVRRTENEKQVLALASYISRNPALAVNSPLARAFTETWKRSPDRHSTAEMLHIVALSGDVALFQESIGLLLKYWQEKRLQDITPEELVALVEGEFWLIPSSARNSGAGFLLKRELAKFRREIAAGRLRQ